MKPLKLMCLFFLLAVISCKKDYECKCKVTQTIKSQTNNPSYGASVDISIKMKKVNKRTAKRNCVKETIERSNSSDYYIFDCELKK